MQRLPNSEPGSHPEEYFLQVVKKGQTPHWSAPEEELQINSQEIGGGYQQYWAYPKGQGRDSQDLPPAELLASANVASQPLLIIDQIPGEPPLLDLVLAKDGHAWAHTQSSINNLEDNLAETLEYAQENFHFTVQNFTATSRVSPEVDKRLNDLENSGKGEAEEEEASEDGEAIKDSGTVNVQPENHSIPNEPAISEEVPQHEIKMVGALKNPWPEGALARPSGVGISHQGVSRLPKKKLTFLVIGILGIMGTAVAFRGQLLQQSKNLTQGGNPVVEEAIPTPLPTPTPTPSLDRSQFKLRVLNGTTKAGAAKGLADELEILGWEVDKTGNASTQAVQQTYIRGKKGLESTIEGLTKDLSSKYQATLSGELKESDTADLEVVIGKE